MFLIRLSTVSLYLLANMELVAAHSAIVSATGDQGGAGSAIGSKSTTAPSSFPGF
jgi:hypothetical protein